MAGLAHCLVVEWLLAAGKAFIAIAPVELPDKTFVATLVLATRYRPLLVWLGVASAFAVHAVVAVAAGSLVAQLPTMPVRLVAAALFAAGAVLMLRAARRGDEVGDGERTYQEKVSAPRRRAAAAFTASFLLLFLSEWGDLSQLFLVGLVASGEPATAVLVGGWCALAAVAGAAVLAGRWLLRRIRLSIVRYVAAAVCAGLAAVIAIAAFA